jgi:hypothetical protein
MRTRCTFKFGHVDAELISLFQYAFAALLDEGIESDGELSHAIAEVFESEVDIWEGVNQRNCSGEGGVKSVERRKLTSMSIDDGRGLLLRFCR